MAVSSAIVTQYYTNVIRVAPTAAQVTFYSNAADAATLLTTLENQATVQVNPIIRLYQGAFNRVPDPVGLNGWVAQYVSGPTGTGTATLNSIATGFVGSAEFASLYGVNPIATVQSQTAMVSNLYTNVLNRPAGQVEVNLWLTEIARQQSLGYSNTQIATNVLLGFTNSPEFITSSAPSIQAFQSSSALNTETYTGSLWAQGAGTTYILTTGIDILTGTSGNDTFIGDFTATATANAGDTLNGGAGTDTLKLFGTYAAGNMPVSLTNIEVLDFANTGAGSIDLTSWTKATTGIATVQFDNATALTGNTITTTAGQALSLSTGSANVGTTGAVTWAGSGSDASLNLILNGYQGAATAVAQALTITGASAATQNIASTGAANKVTTLTLGAIANKLVVTGDKALTVTTNTVSSGGATVLKTVDASANSGGVSLKFAALTNAAFAFTGGSGNDSLSFADNEMGTLTAGSQLDGGTGVNKIGLLDTAITAAEYAALNAAKNFQTVGLNAIVTVDASQLTSIKSFSLDTNAAQAINNMATGSSLAVTAAHAANITTTAAVGVHDLALTVGTATGTGYTLGGTVNIGQDAVALASLGLGSGTNTITTLTAKDNSVYTITGSNDLTIAAITAATVTGSKYDATAFTGKLNITGNSAGYSAGSALGDIIIGGTGIDTIKASVNNGTLTGGLGGDTFDVSVARGGTASLTTITDFTKGDKLTVAAGNGVPVFTAAKVDLSGAASVTAALDLLAAGSGAVNSTIKWGVYSGNTYVVEDNTAGATFAATDVAVKLVGSLDLSTSTLSGVTVTFA